MGQNDPRHQQGERPPDVYWRRRALALALGLGVLGLLAWAVDGTMGGGAPPSQAASVRAGATATPSGGGSPSARAHPVSARSHASASVSPGRSASPAPDASAHAGGHASARACPRHDVVLSLRSASRRYRPGRRPGFAVSVVSTGSGQCSFDIGRAHLWVVIRSGEARVWSSAACATGGGTRVVTLARGVPSVVRLFWDRTTSASGCHRRSAKVGPGTYTATAKAKTPGGSLASKPVAFVLSGPSSGS